MKATIVYLAPTSKEIEIPDKYRPIAESDESLPDYDILCEDFCIYTERFVIPEVGGEIRGIYDEKGNCMAEW